MRRAFSTEHPTAPELSRFHALLVESLDDEHEVNVVRGAVVAARQLDARLLCVAGAAVDDPDPERRAMNFVFNLIDERNTLGVVALSSAIGSAVGPERLNSWLARYRPLPVCSAGVQLEARPFLGVDNHAGMYAAVRHLVETHAARRIAFIAGPEDSVEAKERLRAYQEVLRAAGIDVDPRLILDGDFSKEAGARAVQELFDARGVRALGLDAIVAANDYMALGALKELQRRGVRVPEDLRLIGFDDVESSRLSSPSLTTVRQPAEQLGRRALELLTRWHAGGPTPPAEVLATELVVRRSCGCDALERAPISYTPTLAEKADPGLSFIRRRQVILAELMRAGKGALGTVGQGWETRLLDALVHQLEGRGAETLALAVEQVLARWDAGGVDSAVLQDVLSVLRREALSCIPEDSATRGRLEAALHDARSAAAQGVAAVIEARWRRVLALHSQFDQVAHRAVFGDPHRLSVALQLPLQALGVEACVLAALDNPADVAGDAQVLFAFGTGWSRSGGSTKLWALPQHPALQHVARALVLLPIVVDQEPAGAVIVAASNVDGALLENLRAWCCTLLRLTRLRALHDSQ